MGFVEKPGLSKQHKRIVGGKIFLKKVDAMRLQSGDGVLLGGVQRRHHRFRTDGDLEQQSEKDIEIRL